MQIKFIYPRWGSSNLPWSVFLKKIKNAGYQGVEIDLPLDSIKKKEICFMLKDLELDFVGQHWETKEINFTKHRDSFRRRLYNLAEAQPLLINSHTGMDFFPFAENADLIETAHEIELETGVPITHETHRSRFAYAAHACLPYLEEYPFLKLTSDLSHWCCVAESMLENQPKAVQKAIAHTYHIHARVGSAQSPQVIDPRDSHYKKELHQFLSWWQLMIQNAVANNRSHISITPEYGPPPYALYNPHTQNLQGNQWETNTFIREKILENNTTDLIK